jgi:c(7)-type cytochrome triheme protein
VIQPAFLRDALQQFVGVPLSFVTRHPKYSFGRYQDRHRWLQPAAIIGTCYSSRMRTLIACLLAAVLVGIPVALAQEKAPEKLTFMAKNGNVTFDHGAHAKRANGDCTACHDKLFKKNAKDPLNFKPALHKTAETAQTSCGACHHPGGTAFESKGNCAKCHMKG